MTTAAAIDARGLVKAYGERRVLDALDLRVHAGEIVALLGPNGAGKTTAVEILEGYRRRDAGEVRVLGVDPAHGTPDWRAQVGLMLQQGGVDPRVTPREAIRLFRSFHAAPRAEAELLALVGLDDRAADTSSRRLSGGERQRLALALALVGRPDVLFLDEPTAGMDPHGKAATRALLARLRTDGAAILLTTHDLDDVERVADRVAILHAGRIVAEGRPADVAAGDVATLEVAFAEAVEPARLARLARALSAGWPLAAVAPDADDPRALLVHGVPPSPDLVAAVAGWAAAEAALIAELRAGSGGLEARYIELTGDRQVER